MIKFQKNNLWLIGGFLLLVFLGIGLVNNVFKNKNNKISSAFIIPPIIESVSAQDIYPLFSCPCCGSPLDKKNICCEAAEERIKYVDSLTSQNLNEKEIILTYVKKYGLNSFVDSKRAEDFKKELIKTAPAYRPIISLTPDSYDFGDVSQKKGKVYTFFNLKNEGKSNLVIEKLETSCGCTFAAVVFQGIESPFFTMPGHGSENPEWKGISIPPGEQAQLKIMYDPNVHLDFRGPAIREISVFSNDSIDFEKKVKIELKQTD